MISAATARQSEEKGLVMPDPGLIPDARPEGAFAGVARLAAELYRAPMALIGVIEGDRCWVQAAIGIELDELPRETAICESILAEDGVLVRRDLSQDPRFADDAMLCRHGARFCAGVPLWAARGRRVGVLCVMDRVPRSDVGERESELLKQLARVAADEIELWTARRQLDEERAQRSLAEARLKLVSDLAEAALVAPDFKTAIGCCLQLIAEHVAADFALAYGLAPQAARCELEAVYSRPELDFRSYLEFVRGYSMRAEHSPIGGSVARQELAAIADLSTLDRQLHPLISVSLDHGFRGLLCVPFENAETKFGLCFLFRRPPRQMSEVAETIYGLSGKVRDLLARKQTEERIALLQSVVLHANDAVMITEAAQTSGEDPRIIYINRSFSAMTGYPAAEVLGRTPHFLDGPGTDPAAIETLRRAIASDEPVRVEMIVYRKDGSEFWAEIDLTPVADANGCYTRWIAILRETTARKQAEGRLRERELTLRQLAQRQAAILDALPAHVALLDREGRILSVSRFWHDFAAASGIDAPMPIGHSYFEFCDSKCWGEIGQAIAAGLNGVLSGQQPQFSIDHPGDRGGWRRWYRFMASPLASGESAGAVVMHLDVTSSKLAEEALRREKEFSEFLIKSSTEGIVVFDREYRITLWNPGIERITGMSADHVLARRIFDVLPYLAGTHGEAAMRGALEGRETELYDQRYDIAETGREGYYEAYFSPLYSRGREVIGGIGFLRETTERRRIEDALRQSQKMEAVGQLTGGIAHDFNNMLTVIAGNLELLEGKLGDEPRLLRLVSSAALAASRAEKLTQQLLTFSRRQQLRPQPIDFNQIVIGMDDLLYRTVGEHMEIRKQLSPELWPALADPNQIETALLNLILNARDAMHRGGHITIETGNAEIGRGEGDIAPGAYATLSVSDTGQGMSEEVLARVFEPFFTTKEVGKGTGLGLSQVYGFIKQSSGHIKIESRLGVGTTVRLYLPRAAGIADVAGITPIRDQQYRGNESVLVVEDDHGVRDFAVSVLRELGYHVIEAASGDAALELLESNVEITLLFTDVVMPGRLGGADLAKAALELRPDLQILFTSGYTTRLVERDWPSGTIDFLRKPYRSVDLAARVRAVLNRAAAAAR